MIWRIDPCGAWRAEVARSAIRVDSTIAPGQTGVRRRAGSRVTAFAGNIRRTVRVAEALVVGTQRESTRIASQTATVGASRAIRVLDAGVSRTGHRIAAKCERTGTGGALCWTGGADGTMEQRRARARTLSILRHAGVRERGADGTTAGLGIRQVSIGAGYHWAHHVTDHRRVWLPSVAGSTVHRHASGAAAGRRDQLGPSGTGLGGWSAGGHGAGTDKAVLAGVLRDPSVHRSADGTAAGVGAWCVPARTSTTGRRTQVAGENTAMESVNHQNSETGTSDYIVHGTLTATMIEDQSAVDAGVVSASLSLSF